MKKIVVLAFFLLLTPQFALAASYREEAEAQTYFRLGNIAKERFDYAELRRQRRERWGVRKVRGFSLQENRGQGQGGEVQHAPLVEGPPDPNGIVRAGIQPEPQEKPSFSVSQRVRLRSYVRRGGCPEGLPADYALACREILKQREKKQPSLGYLLRRAKNQKQDQRAKRRRFSLLDRIKLVVPRPRSFDPSLRKSTRTLEE
jgi:hypothetical protein